MSFKFYQEGPNKIAVFVGPVEPASLATLKTSVIGKAAAVEIEVGVEDYFSDSRYKQAGFVLKSSEKGHAVLRWKFKTFVEEDVAEPKTAAELISDARQRPNDATASEVLKAYRENKQRGADEAQSFVVVR